MKNKNSPGAALLRQKAEEQFKKKHSKSAVTLTESGIKKLLYELEVHQIELEMQNQELQLAIDKANTATALYNFSPSGYFTLEPDGIISQLNLSGAKLLGSECSFLVNRNIRTFISPDSLPVVNGFLQKVLETNSKVTCEVRLLSNGHASSFVHLEGYFSTNEQKCLVTALDITKRKQADEKIKTLGKAIEQGPSSIVITNADGNIEFINDKFTQMTQYQLDDVKGRKPRIFNPGRLPGNEFEALWETLQKGNTWKGEVLNRRKDKSEFWEDISISALMNADGTICNYILIMDDITEKKQMMDDLIAGKEIAEESDRLKTAFLATMNHELRTPLNHILGFSELIMSGVAPEDNVSFASSIQSSGQSLLSIIEGVFDLALVEQEHIKLREQTFSLMDHFMENKASFDNILINSGKNENICLVFKPDTRWLTSYVTTERSKINQVLTNLFKNAVKFTHQGTIEFGFKVEKESYLTYFVKDSGIGIPMEKQSIIFDLFRQGDDSITRAFCGIGIGLAISQKITKILKGELTVVSELGAGSTFSLTIPVELSEN